MGTLRSSRKAAPPGGGQMNLDLNFYSDILAGLSAILTAFCSQRPLGTSDPDSLQLPRP